MHMNVSRMWLASWAAAGLALTAAAAPAPAPTPVSQGPISDFLRLRGKLPHTPAPQAMRIRVEDGKIEVERRITQYTQEVRQTRTKKDGREVTVEYIIAVPRFTIQKATVAVKDCKFFRVTRDGKLEAVETSKAAAQLKKTTPVLPGECAEVDPRHLELVKPGTLYLVVPPPKPTAPPDELPRADKP